MDFKDKVCLITGGAAGIGKAVTIAFLKRGAKVCVCDINENEGRIVLLNLQSEFGKENVIFQKCDVTVPEEFEACYNCCEEKFGAVDILCNNAGILSNDFEKTMKVNFESVVNGTEFALKRMGKHKGGRGGFVVNTGSITGISSEERFAGIPVYSASKAAVVRYSATIGQDFHFKYSGVFVVCVCFGLVDTTLAGDENFRNSSLNEFSKSLVSKHVSTASKLTPEEAANAFIKIIEDKKPGSILLTEHGSNSCYVSSSYSQEI